ncbi:4-coumarate--CoA ligase 2 [Fopius arisanus]|uniref:4-coumarate--CoA ligase 2 n=2 Tax=Fopius arisanus TaxID=64838 RepID=A0A9R1T8M3_9HYME|nr:PREDICTED: 4-coumarate--CoA ligase 2-like [Fopius arisanus]
MFRILAFHRRFLSDTKIRLFDKELKSYFGNASRNYNSQPSNTFKYTDRDNVFTSPYDKIEIPSCYLHQVIWKDVDKWRNKTALTCSASGRSYSYNELRGLCGKFATSLRRNNLGPGDTLAVVLPNIPEYAIIALGASEAGVRVTLLNPAYTIYEISKHLAISEASAIITTPQKYPDIMEALKLKNSVRLPTIVVPNGNEPIPAGAINFRDLVSNRIEEFDNIGEQTGTDCKNDTFIIPYSSGTSGFPKGVEITHSNIVANLLQMGHHGYHLDQEDGSEEQDVIPVFLPFYHMFGFVVCFLNYLRRGGHVVCIPQFTIKNLLDVLEKIRTTVLYVVPPVLQITVKDERFTKKHMDYVNSVTSGAAPLGIEIIKQFHAKMGSHIPFSQGYGLTETSPVVARSKYSSWDSSGFIFVNTDVRIVHINDENVQKNLGVNETGEIFVKGPQVMKGYYKNPQATADCIDGGWLKTGDLGYVSEKGELYITGQLKDLIKVKGFQVSPAELEDVIISHEKVNDVAVIGVPHDELGAAPKAFIVPKPNIKVTEEEIKNHVAQRLSKHKHINQITFIDEIPKNATGKILRKELYKL